MFVFRYYKNVISCSAPPARTKLFAKLHNLRICSLKHLTVYKLFPILAPSEGHGEWYQMASDIANAPQPGYCLQTPHLETMKARSLLMCGVYCKRHPQCVSFNFIKSQKLCQLKSTTKDAEAPGDFQAVNGCTYFEQF